MYIWQHHELEVQAGYHSSVIFLSFSEQLVLPCKHPDYSQVDGIEISNHDLKRLPTFWFSWHIFISFSWALFALGFLRWQIPPWWFGSLKFKKKSFLFTVTVMFFLLPSDMPWVLINWADSPSSQSGLLVQERIWLGLFFFSSSYVRQF